MKMFESNLQLGVTKVISCTETISKRNFGIRQPKKSTVRLKERISSSETKRDLQKLGKRKQ